MEPASTGRQRTARARQHLHFLEANHKKLSKLFRGTMQCALAHRVFRRKEIYLNWFFYIESGFLVIAARRCAYSDRAPAAELYRRGISDRLRIAGTVRRYTPEISKIPARRVCAQIDRVGRRQCPTPIFENIS